MSHYSLGTHKILVVDDSALVRMTLVDFLESQNVEVLEAANAEEAIALLDRHSDIEVVVTDIEMPGSMDGVRLAHHVRRRWPPVKILVMSGNVDIEQAGLPDNVPFLRKPFLNRDLWSALSKLAA